MQENKEKLEDVTLSPPELKQAKVNDPSMIIKHKSATPQNSENVAVSKKLPTAATSEGLAQDLAKSNQPSNAQVSEKKLTPLSDSSLLKKAPEPLAENEKASPPEVKSDQNSTENDKNQPLNLANDTKQKLEERDVQYERLYALKKYHLPIKDNSRHGGRKLIISSLFLVTIYLILVMLLLGDAGIIKLPFKQPFDLIKDPQPVLIQQAPIIPPKPTSTSPLEQKPKIASPPTPKITLDYPTDWKIDIKNKPFDNSNPKAYYGMTTATAPPPSNVTIKLNYDKGGRGGSCSAKPNDTPHSKTNECSTIEYLSATSLSLSAATTQQFTKKEFYLVHVRFTDPENYIVATGIDKTGFYSCLLNSKPELNKPKMGYLPLVCEEFAVGKDGFLMGLQIVSSSNKSSDFYTLADVKKAEEAFKTLSVIP